MLKAIAIIEIAGGLIGFGLLYSLVWPRYGMQPTIFTWLAVSFCGLCVAAGVELWRKSPRGFWMTAVAQGAQIVMWSWAGGGYQLQAGPQLLVIARPEQLYFWAGLRASATLAQDQTDPRFFAINFFPLLTMALLAVEWWRSSNRLEAANSANEIAIPPTEVP